MENASKALLMTTSVLIAIMVIGIATYVFNIFGTFAKNKEEDLYNKQIGVFNAQFVKYETMEDINIHDIITVANYAKNYNETYAEGKPDLYVHVNIDGKAIDLQNKDVDYKNNLIREAIDNIYKYKLADNGIEYNNVTGRVIKITFKQKT